MSAVSSVESFLDLLQKSELIEFPRLVGYLNGLEKAGERVASANLLAICMVRDGLLTFFQAQQLLSGKCRGFFINHKYRLLERLGSEEYGRTFLCEQVLMRRLVVLKLLPVEFCRSEEDRARLFRQVRSAVALDHPNLLHAYDVDQDERSHFLVLEYVDGLDLVSFLERTGPVSPARAIHYVHQAALALEAIHQAGWIHRNLHPGNLLLDRKGVVKIANLGLPRYRRAVPLLDGSMTEGDFLAPEVLARSRSDLRADVYCLGAVLYFLLTGQPPLASSGGLARSEPRPLRVLRPDVPPPIAALAGRLLARDPGRRPKTSAEAAAALARFATQPVQAPTDDELPRRSGTLYARQAADEGRARRRAAIPEGPGIPAEPVAGGLLSTLRSYATSLLRPEGRPTADTVVA